MKSAEFVLSTTSIQDVPTTTYPHIAIVGRSNVGKSSLINHLTKRTNLARTSSTAGRTATINLYNIDDRFFLVDLPGYGFTKAKAQRKEFSELIVNYLTTVQPLKLVFVVIDAVAGATELDLVMFDVLTEHKIPFMVIVNKVDKISKGKVAALLQTLKNTHKSLNFIAHSVESKEGRGEIMQAIDNTLIEAERNT